MSTVEEADKAVEKLNRYVSYLHPFLCFVVVPTSYGLLHLFNHPEKIQQTCSGMSRYTLKREHEPIRG